MGFALISISKLISSGVAIVGYDFITTNDKLQGDRCFEDLSYGSKTLDMTSEALVAMFEGDYADLFGDKNPHVALGG